MSNIDLLVLKSMLESLREGIEVLRSELDDTKARVWDLQEEVSDLRTRDANRSSMEDQYE